MGKMLFALGGYLPEHLLYGICRVLIDFSLTVKAVTLIFISGRCSAISSAKGNQVLFIIW